MIKQLSYKFDCDILTKFNIYLNIHVIFNTILCGKLLSLFLENFFTQKVKEKKKVIEKLRKA